MSSTKSDFVSKPKPIFPEVAEARYSRLYPGGGKPHDIHDLEKLVCLMVDESDQDNPRTMPSGYVYFGQFVDHDLTLDNVGAFDATPFPEKTRNYRTPRLDLDLLYGKTPGSTPSELYIEGERLRLGNMWDADKRAAVGPEGDLCRDANGLAQVIDLRSDENLVQAQMHVLWAKLHNCLIDLAAEQPELLRGIPAGTHFERVRQLVIWIYQWVVVYDFLPHFIRNQFWHDVFCRRQLRLYAEIARPTRTPFALPIEFTVAAYRFGHSMVRNGYELNRTYGMNPTAKMLMDMTAQGGGINSDRPQLPNTFVIEWNLFLDGAGKTFNRGARIDTYISKDLFGVKPETVALYGPVRLNARSGLNLCGFEGMLLPYLTLVRGSNMHLPSGEQFADFFGLPRIDGEVGASDDLQCVLKSEGFREHTPLWYYVLREADLGAIDEPGPRDRKPMQKLGEVGSRIIAETFYQVLMADRDSILNAGRHWKPPETDLTKQLNSLPSVADLVTLGEQSGSRLQKGRVTDMFGIPDNPQGSGSARC